MKHLKKNCNLASIFLNYKTKKNEWTLQLPKIEVKKLTRKHFPWYSDKSPSFLTLISYDWPVKEKQTEIWCERQHKESHLLDFLKAHLLHFLFTGRFIINVYI